MRTFFVFFGFNLDNSYIVTWSFFQILKLQQNKLHILPWLSLNFHLVSYHYFQWMNQMKNTSPLLTSILTKIPLSNLGRAIRSLDAKYCK